MPFHSHERDSIDGIGAELRKKECEVSKLIVDMSQKIQAALSKSHFPIT